MQFVTFTKNILKDGCLICILLIITAGCRISVLETASLRAHDTASKFHCLSCAIYL